MADLNDLKKKAEDLVQQGKGVIEEDKGNAEMNEGSLGGLAKGLKDKFQGGYDQTAGKAKSETKNEKKHEEDDKAL